MNPTTSLATCTKCGRVLPREMFFASPVNSSGFRSERKECSRAYRAAYRAANAEKCRAASRAYDAAHHDVRIEKRRAHDAAYRAAHREELRASSTAYRAAHVEERRARHAAWYATNAKSRCAAVRAYVAAHAEERRAYRVTHAEECRARGHNYRARKRTAGGTHTAADIRAQLKRQRGRCFYCGEDVGKTYHADHVVPVVGGGHNGPDNLVVACPSCNLSKGAKSPMDFAGMLF